MCHAFFFLPLSDWELWSIAPPFECRWVSQLLSPFRMIDQAELVATFFFCLFEPGLKRLESSTSYFLKCLSWGVSVTLWQVWSPWVYHGRRKSRLAPCRGHVERDDQLALVTDMWVRKLLDSSHRPYDYNHEWLSRTNLLLNLSTVRKDKNNILL